VPEDDRLQSVSFRFKDNKGFLECRQESGTYALELGLSGAYAVTDVNGVPFAMNACWRSEDKLEMYIRNLNAASGRKAVFEFHGNEMRLSLDWTPPVGPGLAGTDFTEALFKLEPIRLRNDKLGVAISPVGAELMSIRGKDGAEYLWQGDPAFWDRRAINLFPYIARLTNETYAYEGRTYHLPIHGFLPDALTQIESRDNAAACFLLKDTEATRAVYPFSFELRVRYALSDETVTIRFEVLNTGDREMHFGIGGHPGFLVPLEDGLAFTDYTLEFDTPCEPERVCFTDRCFTTGETEAYPLVEGRYIPLRHDLFDHDVIVLRNMSKTVAIKSPKGKKSVTVSFPDMPYVGFWHAVRKEAPYVCVEPWSSLPSRDGVIEDVSLQDNLIHLPAGERYVNEWSITIR